MQLLQLVPYTSDINPSSMYGKFSQARHGVLYSSSNANDRVIAISPGLVDQLSYHENTSISGACGPAPAPQAESQYRASQMSLMEPAEHVGAPQAGSLEDVAALAHLKAELGLDSDIDDDQMDVAKNVLMSNGSPQRITLCQGASGDLINVNVATDIQRLISSMDVGQGESTNLVEPAGDEFEMTNVESIKHVDEKQASRMTQYDIHEDNNLYMD